MIKSPRKQLINKKNKNKEEEEEKKRKEKKLIHIKMETKD